MRVLATMVVLITSCRFDPTGGVVPGDDVVADDAATIDAAPIDAVAVDAASIDALVIDAPPAGCPASYDVLRLGTRYRFDPIAAQYGPAKADCEADLPGRTHLATFELYADMTAAIDQVNPGAQATPWVGASCATNCNAPLAWFWDTGLPIDVRAWAEGQPDAGGNEKVARVDRNADLAQWQLVNVPDTATLPYICECEPF